MSKHLIVWSCPPIKVNMIFNYDIVTAAVERAREAIHPDELGPNPEAAQAICSDFLAGVTWALQQRKQHWDPRILDDADSTGLDELLLQVSDRLNDEF